MDVTHVLKVSSPLRDTTQNTTPRSPSNVASAQQGSPCPSTWWSMSTYTPRASHTSAPSASWLSANKASSPNTEGNVREWISDSKAIKTKRLKTTLKTSRWMRDHSSWTYYLPVGWCDKSGGSTNQQPCRVQHSQAHSIMGSCPRSFQAVAMDKGGKDSHLPPWARSSRDSDRAKSATLCYLAWSKISLACCFNYSSSLVRT